MWAKFRQKILNSTAVGARQSSKFLRQITWFLINKWALSKFKYLILHHLISYFQITKQLVCKTQFYVNHASHHNYFLLSKISISGEQCCTWSIVDLDFDIYLSGYCHSLSKIHYQLKSFERLFRQFHNQRHPLRIILGNVSREIGISSHLYRLDKSRLAAFVRRMEKIWFSLFFRLFVAFKNWVILPNVQNNFFWNIQDSKGFVHWINFISSPRNDCCITSVVTPK